jgi:hypothetical protein
MRGLELGNMVCGNLELFDGGSGHSLIEYAAALKAAVKQSEFHRCRRRHLSFAQSLLPSTRFEFVLLGHTS